MKMKEEEEEKKTEEGEMKTKEEEEEEHLIRLKQRPCWVRAESVKESVESVGPQNP